MSTPSIITQCPTVDPNLHRVRAFFDEQASALCNTCSVLSGPAAKRRCLRLISKVGQADRLQRPEVLELIELHRLLTLQDIGDPDSFETDLASAIDPWDPRVHEFCLLADRLWGLLVELAGQSNVVAQALAASRTHRAA